MRPLSYLFSLTMMLILAGSVTAAARNAVPEPGKGASTGRSSVCAVDRLVTGEQLGPVKSGEGLNPESISVLNWNVYKGKRENWASDFRRYTSRHDVVTIQEAHLDEELTSMLDNEHQYWTLNTAFHYRDKATGVMTASRVKPLHSCGQHTAEPLIRVPKTSLVSFYPIEGMKESLLVANIHGINFTLGVDVYASQLEKLYEIMRLHDGPVILAGDFNTWSDGRMRVVEEITDRLQLESLDYTNHNRTSVFGNALDHVFFRGLDPVEHDTWHVTSSDHNPTRVSFRVKQNAIEATDLAAAELDENNC
jgi:endonuclease/exonuclease/phosphatase (EEP) superfamily protein YafD